MYSFDELTERRGSGSMKWDERPESLPAGEPARDIIPLWVADMDFRTAPPITEALQRRVAHGIFGYTAVGDDYYEAVLSWFSRRHGWTIDRDEILYTTGVVPATSVVIKALTMPGEQVLTLSPAYNCFFSSIRNNGCQVTESPLVSEKLSEGSRQFRVDWDDFERRCAEEKTTLFLLCNPHNPTGRVWNREELERMNTICMRHGVKVVSDEIHCELTMPGVCYQPFATVSDECRHNSVVLTSPTKAFNLAGLQIANIVCTQEKWRRRIDRAININEVCDVGTFGPVALIAAYNDGEQWLDDLRHYLWQGYQLLCRFADEHLPMWRVCALEGTYLPWVDISHTGMTAQHYADRLLSEARVWVNPGTLYGPVTGEGYIRLNIACPHARLEEALRRIAAIS